MSSRAVSIGIRLTADGKQLQGEARLSADQLRRLSTEFGGASRSAFAFSGQAGQATSSTQSLTRSLSSMRGILGALGVSLSAVGLQRLVSGATQAADAIGKLSRSTGISTDDLQRLEFAAAQTGVQMSSLTSGLQHFQRQSIDNAAIRDFASSLDLSGLDTPAQLQRIADEFATISDPAERAALAARLFGRSAGPEMLKLLQEGSDGIARLASRADELGLVLSGESIAAAERFRDAWDEVSRSLTASVQAGVLDALIDDTGELSQSWMELTAALSSAAFRSAISTAVSGIVELTTVAAGGVANILNLVGAIREMRQLGGERFRSEAHTAALDREIAARQEIIAAEEQLHDLLRQRAELQQQQQSAADQWARRDYEPQIIRISGMIEKIEAEQAARRALVADMEAQRTGIDAVTEGLDAQIEPLEVVVTATANQSSALRRLLTAQRGAAQEQAAASRAQSAAAREAERLAQAFGALRDRLDPVSAATRRYIADVDLLDEAWAAGLMSGEEYWDLLNRLASGSAEAATEVRSLTEAADPFATAYEQAVQAVDRAFVGLWESAFRGFRDFADALKNAFMRLLAELAHAALTRPILIQMGLGGVLGAPGAASASGMVSPGMFGAGPAGMMNQTTHGSAMGPYQTATGTGMWGGTGMGYGLSGAGGYFIGSQFGGHGGIGGSLGGMAGYGLATGGSAVGASLAGLGAFAGPIGMAIGSVVGGVLGSMFGSRTPGNRGDRAAWADEIDLATGEARGLRGGDEALTGPRDTLVSGVQQMIAGIHAMGGTLAGEIRELGIGYRGGIQVDLGEGLRTFGEDAEAALDYILTTLLASAEGLDSTLSTLVLAMEGAEERIAMMAALGDLQTLRGRDPITDAISDWESSQRTATEIYRAQSAAVRSLAQEYDGTVAATRALADAYATQQQMAYELAMALYQAGAQIEASIGALRARIVEDLIADEQALYAHRQAQVDALTDALAGMTDPADIMAAVREIEQLYSSMWQSLSADQRQQLGDTFLGALDDLGALAQQRIQAGLDALDVDLSETGRAIDGALDRAAAAFADSAASQQQAADGMQQAADGMQQAAAAMAAAAASIPSEIYVSGGGMSGEVAYA